MEAAKPLFWRYLIEWDAWWLMAPETPAVSRGYGPFLNEFECKMAAEIHGVPFDPPEGGGSAP